jgi:uncharacterized membrane protein
MSTATVGVSLVKGVSTTTINDDLIKRSADIRWPIGFDPVHADLFAHNAVVINAPARSIWAMLIAADAWPDWYSNASDVVVDDPSGELAEDLTFSWKTFGLTIASQVAEFTPYARLGWRLNGNQLRAYHTWLLVPRPGDSTYVVMEEIGMGEGAQHLAHTNPGHMHRGHDLWNMSLKFACET